MKKSIFITGIAGSGKSSMSEELNRLGYRAYDIEELKGMFKTVRKDTGEDFEDYDHADIEKIKNTDWICDRGKLEELVQSQGDGIFFYCGIASNNNEIIPLFDQTILLKASPEVIHQRLSSRSGTDDFGSTEEVRERVLSMKDQLENQWVEQGAVVVGANGSLAEVAKKIIELVQK